jgi:iron(III) transport system ATP-binding protein
MSVAITIDNAVKKYDNSLIIPGLSAKIHNGEFFTLLGPSGCGKTTLLRMIAGFAGVEGGTIAFDDNVINNIPAHKRNIGMVFQNYAIFPHLTVRQNVEYGLKLRKIEKSDLKKRVDEILEVVKITELQDRLPDKLSGGQQQRVALARAVVIHPSVLLMDEPLSNLDAKLRVGMRAAIREIQKKVGITTIYVTHDQEEAQAISDRIAVMRGGIIQQIGSPEQIYSRPYNSFVSTFIGHSNCLTGTLSRDGSDYALQLGHSCTFTMDNLREGLTQGEVQVAVRPEEFVLCESGGITFTVTNKVFLGRYIMYELSSPAINCPSVQWSQDIGQALKTYSVGEAIRLKPNPAKINVFTLDGEESLIKEVRRYDQETNAL